MFTLTLLASGLLWAAGCSLLPRRGDSAAEEEAPSAQPLYIRSHIQYVNVKLKYDLLEYHPQLQLDTIHTVYRNRQPVAQVRITGPQQHNLTAADILEGDPVAGDRIILHIKDRSVDETELKASP